MMNPQNKSRILIADHDQTFLDQLADRLLQMDMEVDFAESGKTAMKLVESETYELVVTEIAIPIFNGLEILRKAKEYNPTAEILILSYSATIDWAEQAVREGAYTFLLRPLNDMREFDEAVRDGLKRQQSRPQQYPTLQNEIPNKDNQESWKVTDMPKPNWEMASSPAKAESHLELSKPHPIKPFPSLNQGAGSASQNRQEQSSTPLAPLSEGTIELNSKGQIISCNAAGRNWLMLEANDFERPIQQLIQALPSQSVPNTMNIQVNGRAAQIISKRIQDRTGSERIILLIKEMDKQTSTSPASPAKVNGGVQKRQRARTKANVSFSGKMKKYEPAAQDQGWSPLGFFDQMKSTIKEEVHKIKENHLYQMLEQQPEEADPDVIMTMSRRLSDVSRGRRTSY